MEFTAFRRTAQGSGASRRLRRGGKVPGIVYAGGTPGNVEIDPNPPFAALKNEKIHSSILTAGHALHASDLKRPDGVTAVIRGQNKNPVLASAVIPRGAIEEETATEEAAAAGGAEVPAAAQKAPDSKAAEGKSDVKGG